MEQLLLQIDSPERTYDEFPKPPDYKHIPSIDTTGTDTRIRVESGRLATLYGRQASAYQRTPSTTKQLGRYLNEQMATLQEI